MHLVVVDNASTDGTAEAIAERYGDTVEVLRLPENMGAVARNRVLMDRNEPYLFMFDDDCSPAEVGTLRAVVEYMESHPYFGALCFRTIESATGDTQYGEMGLFSTRRIPGGYEGVYISGNGMCFRRDAIQRTDGYDERWFYGREELCLACECVYHNLPIAYLPRYTLLHRQAPRAIPSGGVIEKEVRNNIWASFKYFPYPVAALAAFLHTLRPAVMNPLKGNPRGALHVYLGMREALAGLPEILHRRKPIPVSELAHNNRWFFQTFYATRYHRSAQLPESSP
jgi:GT2 family glycosyltransferase